MPPILGKVVTEEERWVDLLCDSCGNSCKKENHFEYMTLNAIWGYGSTNDTKTWDAYVCEKCAEEKLRPIVKFEVGSKWDFCC